MLYDVLGGLTDIHKHSDFRLFGGIGFIPSAQNEMNVSLIPFMLRCHLLVEFNCLHVIARFP